MKMFNTMKITKALPFLAACLSGVLIANAAPAAEQPVHLRGEIVSLTGDELVIATKNGAHSTIKLSEKTMLLDVSKTNLAAVQENSYLGIAAAPAPKGKVRALGVMVFPEGARGLNEGHFPWDAAPRSTMTNATVAKLVKKGGATELEMRFGDKTQAVVLDEATVFGQFVPGKRDLLTVKSKVMVIGQPGEGGATTANVVLVGRDGFLPPI